MFHSVGNNYSDWTKKWLSVSLEHFESFCDYLNKKNYKTIFLNEWYDLESNPSKIKGNEIVLTFDDGYLDNWVFAYPLLKKHGLCGTIFINPEFIELGNFVRPTLDDIGNQKLDLLKKKSIGFLNWAEIKFMDSSDVIDIQSHSMSHDKYFFSNKVIDIYTGQSSYDWLGWINSKETKPNYLNNKTDLIKFGYPIFENDRSLKISRYYPNQKFIEFSINTYENASKSNKKELIDYLNNQIANFQGRFENREETNERYLYELKNSKNLIEEKLNKQIDFLCWPGGGYNELSIRFSKEVGYLASTISKRDKNDYNNSENVYKRISRIGLPSFIKTSKSIHYIKDKNYLCNVFRGKNGNIFIRNYIRLIKLKYLITDWIFKK